MDVMFYGHLVDSNHLLLINIMPIFQFVNKSARWLFLHGISDIDGVLRIVDGRIYAQPDAPFYFSPWKLTAELEYPFSVKAINLSESFPGLQEIINKGWPVTRRNKV